MSKAVVRAHYVLGEGQRRKNSGAPSMAAWSTTGRRIGKIIAWLLAIIVILIVALTVFLLTFDWNHARPYVNDKGTQAIGRPFVINGDLKVGWRHPVGETGWRGWVPWPRFSATNITVANPDW